MDPTVNDIHCDGVTMVERVEANTKMEARGVLVRHYLRQLDLVSVEEVEVSA